MVGWKARSVCPKPRAASARPLGPNTSNATTPITKASGAPTPKREAWRRPPSLNQGSSRSAVAGVTMNGRYAVARADSTFGYARGVATVERAYPMAHASRAGTYLCGLPPARKSARPAIAPYPVRHHRRVQRRVAGERPGGTR